MLEILKLDLHLLFSSLGYQFKSKSTGPKKSVTDDSILMKKEQTGKNIHNQDALKALEKAVCNISSNALLDVDLCVHSIL